MTLNINPAELTLKVSINGGSYVYFGGAASTFPCKSLSVLRIVARGLSITEPITVQFDGKSWSLTSTSPIKYYAFDPTVNPVTDTALQITLIGGATRTCIKRIREVDDLTTYVTITCSGPSTQNGFDVSIGTLGMPYSWIVAQDLDYGYFSISSTWPDLVTRGLLPNAFPSSGLNLDIAEIVTYGRCVAPATGTYTLELTCDDECGLWINHGFSGNTMPLLVGNWFSTTRTAAISLTAGQEIHITTSVKNTSGNGVLRLQVTYNGGGTASFGGSTSALPCFAGNLKCGDGARFAGFESCDDGTTGVISTTGGCDTDCSVISGYQCSGATIPDTPVAKDTCTLLVCGDGVVSNSETCDDGNTSSGDGCSATCTLEAGWRWYNSKKKLILDLRFL